MVTKYEDYTLAELEREAYSTENLLAMELIERLERANPTLFQKAMVFKPRTKYTDGTVSGE